MPYEVKIPEDCAFWTCRGMESPFVCDHRRAPGEIGRCRAFKIPCALETERRDCGMFLPGLPKQKDKEQQKEGKNHE